MDLLQVKDGRKGGGVRARRIVKRARVSKLSGTGECPIIPLFGVKATTHWIRQHLDWLVCSPRHRLAAGRVIRQGSQERQDEPDFF